MSTLTGKDLNLVKPALTDDHKVTIGTDLPANFQKIDDEFTAHLADTTMHLIQKGGDLSGAINYNSVTWNRVYRVLNTEGATNPPPGDYGVLLTIQADSYAIQMFWQITGNTLHTRTNYDTTNWSAWAEK